MASSLPRLGLGLAALVVAAALSCGAAGAAELECQCRANGDAYLLGEHTCLKTNEGYRLARCAMVLNNTSWQIVGDSCASVRLDSRAPVPRSRAKASRFDGRPLPRPAQHEAVLVSFFR